jgi:hypothetical protein
MLAWSAEHATRCSGCGNPLDECTNPDLEEAYEATSVRCFACAARATEARKFQGPEGSAAGLLIAVHRTDQP